MTQSRATALFVVDDYRGNPMLSTANEVHPDCPELQEIVRIADWDDFIAHGSTFDGDLPDVSPTDKVMIQYTSGTTGFPKGALLHHRGLVNNAAHYIDRLGMDDGDTYLTIMPLFHTAGSVMSVLGCISKRGSNVLVETFEPGLVLQLFEGYGVRALMGVPTMLVALMEHPTFESTDLSALKGICSGGSLVPEQMVKELESRFGCSLHHRVRTDRMLTPVSSMTNPNRQHDQDKATTIGPPMPNVEVKIVDVDTGDTLPIGEHR